MPAPVSKAVIPAAGLGTRFLPASKAQPKEMLPLVDKPAIQYVVEEAVRDDIMHERSPVLREMLDGFGRHGHSVVALKQVGPSEISSYGCAAVDVVPPPDDAFVRITDIVEKPAPEDAPSNLAVMGRYLFTP